MEAHGGAAARPHDLDLAEPGSRRPAGAERLEHRLLGGEQTADVLHHRVAVASGRDLAGPADALEEALAMPREHRGEPLELDQIEADAEDAGGGSRRHRSVARRGAPDEGNP